MQEPTATNPTTGETLVLRDGAWVPLDAPPEAAPTATNAAGETLVLENGQWIPLGDAGDNGIYPEVRPGFSQDNPIDLTQVRRDTPEGRELLGSLRQGTWVRGADGTVYALPSSPTTGSVDVGDQPLTPGVYQRPFSVVEDVAKSVPTGVVQGVTGTLGLLGSVRDMIPENLQNPASITRFLPSAEDLNRSVQDQAGEYYAPQSVAGEFANTVGQFAPGVAVPGGVGTKLASWLVPAAASEGAGQAARALEGGERGTDAENWARLGGGLIGGLGVGGAASVRSGADNVLRNAAENVTPDQLAMAAALRSRSPVPLTNAEALQQVTGGATGLGRVQRVVEGANSRLAPMMSQRPERVDQAITGVLDQIAPSVPGPQVAGQAQEAATGVLDTMRRRVNESAQPLYDQLPGQALDPADLARLQANPSYSAASEQLMGNPELAALVAGGPEDLSTVNRVIQQLDTMGEQARPGAMNPTGNNTLASQRDQAAALARQLAGDTSPQFAQARQTVATGREAFVEPLRRGPIGAIAGQSDVQPNLAGQTQALFPAQPFEGQAAETARALQMMGEIDPNVGGPLVRQHLARQAAEANQANVGGANQFGGAKFAAQAFGNPLQRETVLGAVDTAAPMASRDIRDLIEGLSATGQREPQGSMTAFNTQLAQDMSGGNVAGETLASILNPLRVPGRIAGAVDEITTRRNAQTLADLLVANSDEFSARLTRATRRPRGANRIRAGVAFSSGQED